MGKRRKGGRKTNGSSGNLGSSSPDRSDLDGDHGEGDELASTKNSMADSVSALPNASAGGPAANPASDPATESADAPGTDAAVASTTGAVGETSPAEPCTEGEAACLTTDTVQAPPTERDLAPEGPGETTAAIEPAADTDQPAANDELTAQERERTLRETPPGTDAEVEGEQPAVRRDDPAAIATHNGVDDDAPASVEELLAELLRERQDLEDRIAEVDADVDNEVGILTEQRVNAEERAGVAREHEQLLLEEIDEMTAEIAAFPSDSLLRALTRTHTQRLEERAKRHIDSLGLMLAAHQATIGITVERDLAQHTLDTAALSLGGIYGLSRKEKYAYASLDDKFQTAAALDTVAVVTDHREMLARIAHSDLCELLETEMMLDGDCLDARQRDAVLLHDIHEHRQT